MNTKNDSQSALGNDSLAEPDLVGEDAEFKARCGRSVHPGAAIATFVAKLFGRTTSRSTDTFENASGYQLQHARVPMTDISCREVLTRESAASVENFEDLPMSAEEKMGDGDVTLISDIKCAHTPLVKVKDQGIDAEDYANKLAGEDLKQCLRYILGDRQDIDDARTIDDLSVVVDTYINEFESRGSESTTLNNNDVGAYGLPVFPKLGFPVPQPTVESKHVFTGIHREVASRSERSLERKLTMTNIFDVLCRDLLDVLAEIKKKKTPSVVLYRSYLVVDDFTAMAIWLDSMEGIAAIRLAVKDADKKHPESRISTLENLRAGITTVVLVSPNQTVESTYLEIVDVELETPALSANLVSNIYAQCYLEQVAIPNEEWVRHLMPTDLLIVDPEFPCKFGEALKTRVLARRSRRISSNDVVALSDLHGLGHAKQWALNTIADIKAAAVGEIKWSDIDNGALIEGPTGVGKTALVRAIAKDSGVHVHATTATSWMGKGHLSDMLAAMSEDFEIARKNAPSILFIDEIDAIGNRDRHDGHHDQWITWTVNHLLTLIDGFSRKQKIIVIGATNRAYNVDRALRRAGRLDRIIKVELPEEKDRKAIFNTYLSKFEHTVSKESINQLGRISAGLSGADIEMYVREAKARARRKCRLMQVEDLFECISGIPEDIASVDLTPSAHENAAWRLAGRSLVAHVYGVGEILQLNVYPRGDGEVGSVAVAKVDRPLKDREYFRSAIAVEMAERAVEEHRFGNGRGTVASGHIFDVSVKIAEEMVKTWRLCEDAPYSTAGFESSREINEHVERELKFAYSLALSAIKRHYRVVKEVAGRLIKKGEMTGGEFYAIINQDEDLGAAHRFIRQANS